MANINLVYHGPGHILDLTARGGPVVPRGATFEVDSQQEAEELLTAPNLHVTTAGGATEAKTSDEEDEQTPTDRPAAKKTGRRSS